MFKVAALDADWFNVKDIRHRQTQPFMVKDKDIIIISPRRSRDHTPVAPCGVNQLDQLMEGAGQLSVGPS